jgi:hypothetical protein
MSLSTGRHGGAPERTPIPTKQGEPNDMIQTLWLQAYAMATGLMDRMDRTERGDVSEKTVTTATFVALALTVGGIITVAVVAAANAIDFG